MSSSSKRLAVSLSLLSLLAACGHNQQYELAEVTATRLTDDRVQLSLTVLCTTVGYDRCDHFQDVCVQAV